VQSQHDGRAIAMIAVFFFFVKNGVLDGDLAVF
jgi:hypothetical protein